MNSTFCRYTRPEDPFQLVGHSLRADYLESHTATPVNFVEFCRYTILFQWLGKLALSSTLKLFGFSFQKFESFAATPLQMFRRDKRSCFPTTSSKDICSGS
jgi:hypothetical protein